MLKHKGQWELLTVEERLFLLSMSHLLSGMKRLHVVSQHVMSTTALDSDQFHQVAKELQDKDLVKKSGDGLSLFCFTGDAVTSSLCGEKLDAYNDLEKNQKDPGVVMRPYFEGRF